MANTDVRIRLNLDGAPAVTQGVNAAAAGMERLGAATVKAGGQAQLTGQQMAQMSAQVQDFIVQLQAGGNPLTAFLQQGSQLSAVFGGVGNAFRAVASLVTPTVAALAGAATAVGALGAAYASGAAEQDAFARALLLTGNASGKTVGQLNEQAKAIASLVGTQAKAAEALAAVAGNGGIAAGAFGKVSEAAVRMERVVGQSIDTTVQLFAKLADNPLQAAAKLNEQTNFLTAAVYKQIAALESQGNAAEAARVAQTAYADALIERTQRMEARFGLFERSWKSLGDTAKGAWDKMLNVGRPDTLEEAVARAEASVNAAQARLEKKGRRGGTTAELRGPAKDEELEAAQALLATAREGLKIARQQAEAEESRTRRVRALADTESMVRDSLSDQLKLQQDLAKARLLMEIAGRSEAEILAVQRSITEQYAKRGKAAGDAFAAERDAAQEWARVLGKASSIVADVNAKTDGLTNSQRELVSYLSSPAYQTNSEAMREIAVANLIAAHNTEANAKAQEALTRALAEGQRAQQQAIAAQDQRAGSAAAALQAMEDEMRAAGLAAAANITLAEATERVTIAKLQARLASAGVDEITEAEINGINREIAAREKLIGVIQSRAARDANAKAIEEQGRLWDDLNTRIGTGLADALMEGGDSAAEYLKRLFADMVLRPLVQAAVAPISGALTTALVGAAGGGGGGMGSYASLLSSAFGKNGISSLWSGTGIGGATTVNAFGGTATVSADLAALYGGNAQAAAGFESMAAAAGNAGAGGAGASWVSSLGWIGAIIAAVMESERQYNAGMNLELLSDARRDWGIGEWEALNEKRWKALGISDKWASVLSGSPLTARLFGSKPSASGFGVGTVLDGDFNLSTQRPFNFGDNVLGAGVDEGLQDLASRIAAQVGISAKAFGGGLTDGLRVGAFTDRDREGEVAALLGFLGADGKLISGVQTGTGSFAGTPGSATKIKAEELQAWISEQMPAVIIQGLQQSDLADRFDAFFDALDPAKLSPEAAQEALATATGVQQLTDALSPLGGVFLQLSAASVDAVAKLAQAAGGFDAFGQSAASYFQNFYSASERTDIASRGVRDALAELGLTMPDLAQSADQVRAAWRSMVDAQDITTDSGREATNTLLGLSGAMGELIDGADAARQKAAQAAAKAADRRFDLENDLLRAQGREWEAVAREREKYLAGLRAEGQGLAELQTQIYALADAAANPFPGGITSMAQAEEALAAKNAGSGAAWRANLEKQFWEEAGTAGSWAAEFLRTHTQSDGTVNAFTLSGALNDYAIYQADKLQREERQMAEARARDGTGTPGPVFDQPDTSAARLVEELQREQLNATRDLIGQLDSLEASLGDYMQSLVIGDLSTLTPQQQLEEARGAVDLVLAQARAGDLAAAQSAQHAVDTFLRTSQAFNGSTEGFVGDRQYGIDVLKEIAALLEKLEAVATQHMQVTAAAGSGTIDAVNAGNSLTAQQVADQLLQRAIHAD